MTTIENNPRITALYTAFRRDCSPAYKFHGECHDFYELVCVIDGSVSITADFNVFELKKGQSILHPPMQFHNVYNIHSDGSIIIVFTFSGDNIPDLENRICIIEDLSKVKSLLEMADKYYVKDGIVVDGVKDRGHFRFIKEFELFLLSLTESDDRAKLTQGAKNYAMIVKAINDNLSDRLTVSSLAKLCNMSEVNLQKTFSKYAGVGVMEYCKRMQMDRAHELLKDGKTVKETALELGYADQNYFSTVFKRITGHTPSEIKK